MDAARPLDLDAFAYVVAHDLKAPLRGLGLFLTVLQEDLDDRLSAQERETFAAVRDELRRMDDLVGAVRRFAQPDAAEGSTDARAAVRDAWRAVGGPGSGKHLVVGDLRPLPIPPLHAAVVLRELLGNAVEHGGTTITVEDDGGLVVRDDGGGLPASLEELAQPFAPGAGGRGIGLALSQHLLAHHGATLTSEFKSGSVLRIQV